MCQKIHYWFYNKSRGSSSGTSTRSVLNLKSTSRLLQPWQAFAKLFGQDMKSRIAAEWQEYQEANPDVALSPQDRFSFHNKKMQDWYGESDPEVKEQVEVFRQQHREGLVEGDEGDDTNRLLQKYVIQLHFAAFWN